MPIVTQTAPHRYSRVSEQRGHSTKQFKCMSHEAKDLTLLFLEKQMKDYYGLSKLAIEGKKKSLPFQDNMLWFSEMAEKVHAKILDAVTDCGEPFKFGRQELVTEMFFDNMMQRFKIDDLNEKYYPIEEEED